MILVDLSLLIEFSKKHADARKSLATWKSVAEIAVWKKKQDVLADFPGTEPLQVRQLRRKPAASPRGGRSAQLDGQPRN